MVTDHKPLTTLLGPKSGITTLAAARLQRWALLLAAYQYNIREYRSTENQGNGPIACPVCRYEAKGQAKELMSKTHKHATN